MELVRHVCMYIFIYTHTHAHIYIPRACARYIWSRMKKRPKKRRNDTAVRYARLSLSDEASADRRAIDRRGRRGMIKTPRRKPFLTGMYIRVLRE